MGKVILLTAYRRPAFFQRVLDALAGCWGIAEYTVLVSVDTCAEQPHLTAQCVELAREFKATRDVRIRVHDPKLGIDGNKLFAFPQAFKEADYCIHFEDDIIPAKDCLRFLEWGGERFRIDPAVLSVSAYQKECLFIDGDTEWHKVRGTYGSYRGQGGFAWWGIGVWQDRWQAVIGDESAYRAFAGNLVNGRMDWWWKKWMEEHSMCQIHPYVSRCQNLVGEPGTENEGVNSNDPLAMENFNSEGVWQLGDLPDPSPDVWRVK